MIIPPRMTYDNPNPDEPMGKEIRDAVASSVVYDTTRHSIYAQGSEYGYIGNVTSEVTVRNAANDNKLTIILNVKDGVAELKEYIPVSFASFAQTVTTTLTGSSAGSSPFEAGKSVNINDYVVKFKGTGPATYFWVGEVYNKEYTYTTAEPLTGNWESNTTYHLPVSISNYTINGGAQSSTNHKWNTLTSYSVSFTGVVQDDRMHTNNEVATSTITLTWYNHVMMGHIGATKADGTSMNNVELRAAVNDLSDITNLMNNTPDGDITVISKYKDVLSNKYTACGTVNCTNSVGTYIYLAIPKAFGKTTASLTGVLGGSATQQFISAITKSYTNGQGVTTDYDFFISDGQNWYGKTFVVS